MIKIYVYELFFLQKMSKVWKKIKKNENNIITEKIVRVLPALHILSWTICKKVAIFFYEMISLVYWSANVTFFSNFERKAP